MTARAIMVLGTSSHVGKSLITAALCRIFAQHGYRVAPFKSQNMSLNSAATIEGLEIGRAQALQAEAAGILPTVDMNPVLLKPGTDMTSQIVVRGRIWGTLSAAEYHQRRVQELIPVITDSYERLASQHQVIVLEGAGSPAEINLKQNDIVNMRMAEIADAQCLLVGDIDRGGVFASLFGTVALLDPAEQARIRGFVINKFRGDLELLAPGIRMIEERIQKNCIGVIPYLHSLSLEEEDSLGLPEIKTTDKAAWMVSASANRPLRIAILALPSFSNFTDFDALRAEPSVSICFCQDEATLAQADVVVVPGSKQTARDLLWMRERLLDQALLKYARSGLIVGICGGMQMLGQQIHDPDAMEYQGSVIGLGLLPIQTSMQSQKVTRLVDGRLVAPSLFGQPVEGLAVHGYEIHVGETSYQAGAMIFAEVRGALTVSGGVSPDGCITPDTRIFGSYLHGLFDDDGFRHSFVASARMYHHLHPADRYVGWKQQREASIDRLAMEVEDALDMKSLFEWVGLQYSPVSPQRQRVVAS